MDLIIACGGAGLVLLGFLALVMMREGQPTISKDVMRRLFHGPTQPAPTISCAPAAAVTRAVF
jgi:hypothetical protein